MTGTPARDALVEAERNLFAHWMQGHFDGHPVLDHENGYSVIRAVLTDQLQPFVIAALVEAGWRPSDEELRAMGGRHRYTGDGMLTYIDLGWHFPSSEVQRP